MECYYPGRVIVSPAPETEGNQSLIEQISREFGGDFELEYRIDDLLAANNVEWVPRKMAPLPFVGRVPEGSEGELSRRISTHWQVGAASPDFLIYPSAISINDKAIGNAVNFMKGIPRGPCGSGCRIGILDSGVDPSLIDNANLHAQQYDAIDPLSSGGKHSDATGHGSLIAHIIQTVAPGAELIPIKTFENNGTISSVIAALYLSQAVGPCDVINLSFGVRCTPMPCLQCGMPTVVSTNLKQLAYFFETFLQAAGDVVVVAAAGNNTNQIALPAAFDKIIAVGTFDYQQNIPASNYQQVPTNRYVMAPGGLRSASNAFAERAGISGPQYYHGTSFAAAFVSGFAARAICGLKFKHCGSGLRGSLMPGFGSGSLATVLGELLSKAYRDWTDFDTAKHGLGVLRF